ncbi:phosphohydrolase [Flavobacteriales bacterium 34_180_T64]|nr:phosphohydrolase [Flavobacteriales bacterium 34_180_T64]
MKINTTAKLRETYGYPSGRTKEKVLSNLDKHAVNFIEKSPFLIMSTSSIKGKLDASPRGGVPGFVHIRDENTILIPDSKGNNRVDSLSNIVETGTIGLLFLIPGMDETLRINGKAYVSNATEDLSLFMSEKNQPKACVIVEVEELFLHCAKALMRSKLWDEKSKINRNDMPSMGQMLKDQLNSNEPAETHDAMLKRYEPDL